MRQRPILPLPEASIALALEPTQHRAELPLLSALIGAPEASSNIFELEDADGATSEKAAGSSMARRQRICSTRLCRRVVWLPHRVV